MKRFIYLFLSLVLFEPGFAADSSTPEFREWSDNTGTFRVVATLVDFDKRTGAVQLQLQSGETIDLPMRRLSVSDQNYVNTRVNSLKANEEPVLQNIAGIDWLQTKDGASRVALGRKLAADDRPIMCFRALGDLQGFM